MAWFPSAFDEDELGGKAPGLDEEELDGLGASGFVVDGTEGDGGTAKILSGWREKKNKCTYT